MVIGEFAFKSHYAIKTYLYLSFFEKPVIVSTVKPILYYKVFYPNRLVKHFFLRYSMIINFYIAFRK